MTIKERAIYKIEAKIKQKEVDLGLTEFNKKNTIGYLRQDQYDSLIEHHRTEIEVYEYILRKLQ